MLEVLQEMGECLIVSLQRETLSLHHAVIAMCTIRHLECAAGEESGKCTVACAQ